uniref:Uncharacterized protein n=1 Tax=Panagrellus redivivus TaxID=6233 RepID=A0A7E4VK36_PANRE
MIEMKFVSLATCHLECSPLREASCNVVAELGERLKAYAEEHLDGEAEAAMKKKLANLHKAGIEAIKYCIAEPGLQVVHEADEDEEVQEDAMATAVEMEVDEMDA